MSFCVSPSTSKLSSSILSWSWSSSEIIFIWWILHEDQPKLTNEFLYLMCGGKSGWWPLLRESSLLINLIFVPCSSARLSANFTQELFPFEIAFRSFALDSKHWLVVLRKLLPPLLLNLTGNDFVNHWQHSIFLRKIPGQDWDRYYRWTHSLKVYS